MPINLPTAKKLCLFCQHFYITPGEEDWSEFTPGAKAELWCEKNMQIYLSLHDIEQSEYQTWIEFAENCPSFTWHPSILERINDQQ